MAEMANTVEMAKFEDILNHFHFVIERIWEMAEGDDKKKD